MSAESIPIGAEQFIAAIQELPTSSVLGKILEIENSLRHLEVSNAQLEEFARAGDQDCRDALVENADFMTRMRERVLLLQQECQRRGIPYPQSTPGSASEADAAAAADASAHTVKSEQGPSSNGRADSHDESSTATREIHQHANGILPSQSNDSDAAVREDVGTRSSSQNNDERDGASRASAGVHL